MATYVKYIGLAHARVITADEWKGVGVTDQETAVWDYTNGHAVPAEKFGDVAMGFLRRDTGFVIVGSDDKLDTPLSHQMTPGQAGSPKVDMFAGAPQTGDTTPAQDKAPGI